MTDTTDIKALRESAESIMNLLENLAGYEPQDIDTDAVELRFEDENGFDTGCDISIVDTAQQSADIIRALLDQLEAERQRADDAQRAGDNARSSRDLHHKVSAGLNERLIKSEARVKELEALKGEQVPVGKFVFEPSGERWHHIKHGEHQHTEPKLKLVKLFTAPQKPVVTLGHIKISEVVAAVSLEQNRKWNGRVGYMAGWNACIDAAIAGGIVKDGE